LVIARHEKKAPPGIVYFCFSPELKNNNTPISKASSNTHLIQKMPRYKAFHISAFIGSLRRTALGGVVYNTFCVKSFSGRHIL
jgi:hypothetical protein